MSLAHMEADEGGKGGGEMKVALFLEERNMDEQFFMRERICGTLGT